MAFSDTYMYAFEHSNTDPLYTTYHLSHEFPKQRTNFSAVVSTYFGTLLSTICDTNSISYSITIIYTFTCAIKYSDGDTKYSTYFNSNLGSYEPTN